MKKALILMLMLLNYNNVSSQGLKVVYGDRLFYFDKDEVCQVKQVEKGGLFQGYDVVDSAHIFVAYDPGTSAEATTILAVYDLKKKKEYLLFGQIGGTGESFFSFNQDNGLVVFNWLNGIYTFRLNLDTLGGGLKNFQPEFVFECKTCSAPFWIDEKTIGYQVWQNRKAVTKYYQFNNGNVVNK